MSIANPYLHSAHPTNQSHIRLKRWAAIASLSVATVLITVKFFAYMLTDSVSILSSLMDSGFDGLASLVTMLGIAHAATPADEEHRFGHGKIEAMAAMSQAIFIFGSAIFLLFESLHRFVHPTTVKALDVGFYTIVLSLVMTGMLMGFQHYVIKKTSSIAISADHLHYKGDILMNLAVFAALALSAYSPWPYFDPLFAAGIALILLSGVRAIATESYDILMDKEIPLESRDRIIALVKQHGKVRDMHDLRTRTTGDRIFIEFHMEMDGQMTLQSAHDVTEDVERVLYEAFPTAEVLIHQEPAGIDDYRIDDAIAEQVRDA